MNNGVFTIQNVTLKNNRVTGILSAGYDINRSLIKSNSKFSFILIGYNVPITIGIESSGNILSASSKIDKAELDRFLDSKIR